MRTAIFVDGAYLGKILDHHYSRAVVAYDRLAKELARGEDVLRSYYYDSLPYQSNPPNPDESKRFAARQSFFAALRKLPKFEVREGRCARQPDGRGGWRYVQKRVDVLLSVDLVRLASKNQIGRAVVLAGDSDFLPAIAVAKDEGVSVTIIHSPDLKEIHRELWEAGDERFPFDQDLLDKVKR